MSEEVAIQMVKGIYEMLHCDYAISEKGIAGQGGVTVVVLVKTI